MHLLYIYADPTNPESSELLSIRTCEKVVVAREKKVEVTMPFLHAEQARLQK